MVREEESILETNSNEESAEPEESSILDDGLELFKPVLELPLLYLILIGAGLVFFFILVIVTCVAIKRKIETKSAITTVKFGESDDSELSKK